VKIIFKAGLPNLVEVFGGSTFGILALVAPLLSRRFWVRMWRALNQSEALSDE
jgi:hypothetical protein